MVSAHDLRCLAGIDTGHLERYYTRWLGEDTDPPNSLTVDYLRVAREGKPPYTNDTTLALGSEVRDRAGAGGLDNAGTYGDVEGYVRPSVINEAIAMDLSCARDHKWRLVSMAIERQECNCLNQVSLNPTPLGFKLHDGMARFLRAKDRYITCTSLLPYISVPPMPMRTFHPHHASVQDLRHRWGLPALDVHRGRLG